MKTAMRLIEYEKELSTKEVYSMVVIACMFNGCWRDCSNAFVKLERLDTATPKQREQYENLAFQLFGRHPPTNQQKQEYKCPKYSCQALITEFDTSCRECGSHFSPCIASGQSILAKEYYTCKTCKHKALESALRTIKLRHCTLCHGKIEPEFLEQAAGGCTIGDAKGGAGARGAAGSKPRRV